MLFEFGFGLRVLVILVFVLLASAIRILREYERGVVFQLVPRAMQLRYMQTLANLAGERTSTIVFPMPMEFLASLGTAAGGKDGAG